MGAFQPKAKQAVGDLDYYRAQNVCGTMCAGTHGGARERKSVGLVLATTNRPTPSPSYWRIKR